MVPIGSWIQFFDERDSTKRSRMKKKKENYQKEAPKGENFGR